MGTVQEGPVVHGAAQQWTGTDARFIKGPGADDGFVKRVDRYAYDQCLETCCRNIQPIDNENSQGKMHHTRSMAAACATSSSGDGLMT